MRNGARVQVSRCNEIHAAHQLLYGCMKRIRMQTEIHQTVHGARSKENHHKKIENANNQTDCAEWIHREQLENVPGEIWAELRETRLREEVAHREYHLRRRGKAPSEAEKERKKPRENSPSAPLGHQICACHDDANRQHIAKEGSFRKSRKNGEKRMNETPEMAEKDSRRGLKLWGTMTHPQIQFEEPKRTSTAQMLDSESIRNEGLKLPLISSRRYHRGRERAGKEKGF